jgi:hypothetical protein
VFPVDLIPRIHSVKHMFIKGSVKMSSKAISISARSAKRMGAGALFFLGATGALTALGTSAAMAQQCAQWKVDGRLVLAQSNKTSAVLTLRQTGAHFSGTGGYSYWHDTGRIGVGETEMRNAGGPVAGNVAGNKFEATVRWSNGSVGVYRGEISREGILSGHTFDQSDPDAQADFYSETPLQCLSMSPPGVGGAPKPALALGRVQSDTPAPTPGSLCEAAQSARARDSRAAPGLERQCAEQMRAAQARSEALARYTSGSQVSTGDSGNGIPAALLPAGDSAANVRSMHRAHGRAAGLTLRSQEQSALGAADSVMLNPQPLPPKQRRSRRPAADAAISATDSAAAVTVPVETVDSSKAAQSGIIIVSGKDAATAKTRKSRRLPSLQQSAQETAQ